MEEKNQRKIIHIDMDAFYAAVEQRDFPHLRGKPLIVGGDPDRRGVVATASYEARAFGVRSAMPGARAQRLCPQAVFVRPRFEVYRQVSRQIQTVLRRYAEQVEPLSLDEAYLDVSESGLFNNSATLIARDIRQQIFEQTQLTASAGVSYNKFLAKLASEINKPDGLFLIRPEDGPAFVEALPVAKFHGIGRATEKKMKSLGILTGADLKTWPLRRLVLEFGKVGRHYYQIARGIDERPVESARVRKSVSSETTFEHDLRDTAQMLEALQKLALEVTRYLAAKQLRGYTVTIKVRYADFKLVTRSRTSAKALASMEEICAFLPGLLARTEAHARPVRLLGVGVSNFAAAGPGQPRQLELF